MLSTWAVCSPVAVGGVGVVRVHAARVVPDRVGPRLEPGNLAVGKAVACPTAVQRRRHRTAAPGVAPSTH